jgi:hypothetical protein
LDYVGGWPNASKVFIGLYRDGLTGCPQAHLSRGGLRTLAEDFRIKEYTLFHCATGCSTVANKVHEQNCLIGFSGYFHTTMVEIASTNPPEPELVGLSPKRSKVVAKFIGLLQRSRSEARHVFQDPPKTPVQRVTISISCSGHVSPPDMGRQHQVQAHRCREKYLCIKQSMEL